MSTHAVAATSGAALKRHTATQAASMAPARARRARDGVHPGWLGDVLARLARAPSAAAELSSEVAWPQARASSAETQRDPALWRPTATADGPGCFCVGAAAAHSVAMRRSSLQ